MAKTTKTQALAKRPKAEMQEADPELLAQLRESFPFEPSQLRIQLPRLSMTSQDKTEVTGKGKDKKIKVLEAAGTFFIERQTDETDPETGNKKWSRTELGEEIEGIIVYFRKQLRMFDEGTGFYTSSPIFDTPDEVVPLFCNKAEVARGTAAELKAKYAFKDKDGKMKSKLEDNKILYVLYEDEVYQMNLRGSSMYSYMTYARKVTPPAVLTRFSSEAKEKGDIEWNQMVFEALRPLNTKEAKMSLENVKKIREAVAVEKASFASMNQQRDDADEKFRKEVGGGKEEEIEVIDARERGAKDY
jgi:hypothetical protein